MSVTSTFIGTKKGAAAFVGLALVIVAAASLCAYTSLERQHSAIIEQRFDDTVRRVEDQLKTQLRTYEFGLRGARGAAIAVGGDGIDRERFHQYSMTRDIALEFPGSRGFGFIWRVEPSSLPTFLARARSEGRPDFAIKELAPNTGTKFVIEYIEPEEPNRQAIGLDAASEPRRREAALQALATGQATLTAPLTLAQALDRNKHGLLLLLPVFRPGFPVRTPEERRTAAIGWTFTPLVIDEVLASFDRLGGDFGFSLSDEASDAKPFFTTGELAGFQSLRRRHVSIFGRKWLLQVWALPGFVGHLNFVDPALSAALVFLAGSVLTALLYLYLANRHRRWQANADRLRLAAIVESSNDAFIGSTLDGVVTDWNRAAERMFGYTAEEAIGRTELELIVPADQEREEAVVLARVRAGETIPSIYTERRRRDASLFAAAITVSPIRAPGDKIIGAAKILRDVSREKAIEIALGIEQSRSSAIVQGSQDAIIGKTLTGMVTSWNPAAERLFGFQAVEAIGRTVADFLVPADLRDQERDILARIAKGENVPRFRTRRRTRSGEELDMILSLTPIRSPNGTLIGAATVARDIGAGLAAERQIRQLNDSLERQVKARTAQLKTSIALQSAIIEQTGYAVIATDGSGIISLFNPAAEEMLGFEKSEVVGRSTPEIFNDPKEHKSRTSITEDGSSRTPGASDDPYGEMWGLPSDGTWSLLRKDRRCVPAKLNIRELRSSDNVAIGFLLVARDLTEQLAREAELDTARRAAESAAKAKAEFLATMSHELRTPLNSIVGFSGLLRESGELNGARAERHARIVHDASLTLLSIVNDVLDVSKLEASCLELDLHSFAIRDLVETVVDILRGQADRKGINLLMTVSADLPQYFVGDSARLRQILLNLVSNALKFTAFGSVRIEISSVAQEAGGYELCFSVNDTGIGIPAPQHDRIFQRFSQADSSTSRRYGGSGLGLAICKSLVELMGGRIGFESIEGRGSKFWFCVKLPLASGPPRFHAKAGDGRTTRALSILLAEDVLVNQELAVAHLTKWGHQVDVVSNGVEAVEAAGRNVYDLILMDVHMPTMDGIEATIRIRALEGGGIQTPIIAMTANVMADEIEQFKQAGFDAHIGKPFLPERLKTIIERWSELRAPPVAAIPKLGDTITQKRASSGIEAAAAAAGQGVQREVGTGGLGLPLDEEVVAEIEDLLGGERVAKLAEMLREDLAGRFADPSDRGLLQREAHMTRSASGALGLARLSLAAQRLEEACLRRSDVTPALKYCREARDEAVEVICLRFRARQALQAV